MIADVRGGPLTPASELKALLLPWLTRTDET